MLLVLFPGLKEVGWNLRGQVKTPFKISVQHMLSTIIQKNL